MEKDKRNPQSEKKKRKSSISFFCCGSTTRKKKKPKTNSASNNNSSQKEESHNSALNNCDRDKEKLSSQMLEVIPVPNKIDNSNNNTMVMSSAEKTSNINIKIKATTTNEQSNQPKFSFLQMKEEQMVMPIKEEDIHLDVNKSIQINLNKSNEFESNRSINPIIDPFLSQEAIKNDEGDGDKKAKDNQIKVNLESMFSCVHVESNRSYNDNRAIVLTEQTPKRLYNPLNETQVKPIREGKDIFSQREQATDIKPSDQNRFRLPINYNSKDNNTIKPTNTNETNIIQPPIGEKAFLESNESIEIEGIEFNLQRSQKDSQSINNELIHKQIEVKPMNCSMIVNKVYHEKVISNPSITGRVHQSHLKPDSNIPSPTLDKRNESDSTKNNLNDQQKNQYASPEKPIEIRQSLNYINNNCDDDSKANLSEDYNYCVDAEDDKETISKYSENRSVISSYVLTVPKMISGINDSYAPSIYTRSEYKETTSNFLPTESTTNLRLIPTNVDDTEFEITNENGEGFCNFIETPRTSNVNFRKSNRDYSNVNPQLKEIYDKVHHKEKEIKRLNEKITKLMSDTQKCEEENKKYDRWIEKEESDGEMLRHMLNYLNSK